MSHMNLEISDLCVVDVAQYPKKCIANESVNLPLVQNSWAESSPAQSSNQ